MCFSLIWLRDLCVWIVMIVAVIAIVKLVLPWLLSQIGIPLVGQIINIVLWAFVAVMCIYVVFALLSCLFGGGVSFPHLVR